MPKGTLCHIHAVEMRKCEGSNRQCLKYSIQSHQGKNIHSPMTSRLMQFPTPLFQDRLWNQLLDKVYKKW